MEQFKGRSTLTLIQSIKTVPSAFSTTMNTCGRICVHKSGRFVIVSNRGHESIAVFRVRTKGAQRGQLQSVGFYHTRGETPRHFQFDSSGQYLIVANQDSDTIAVFSFNLSSGEIKYTGNEYRVPSPNFVCCCPSREDDLAVPSSINGPTVTNTIDVDSDLGNESDGSTMDAQLHERGELEKQLEAARLQVEELQRRLARMSA
jgi:DNA-binding beta-propeller fold protein YncE